MHRKKTLQSGIALITTILILIMMGALLVGVSLLVVTEQRLGGFNRDHSQSFYAAEAGMEKLTADLGTLFDANYAPSGAQIKALATNPPPLPGYTYVSPGGGSGYTIDFPANAQGNPLATNRTILSGPYQGLVGLITPYTLTVTSHSANGSEVKLQRTLQTVGIPVFQFGIFSQTDVSFFAGPNFNFGGRVHSNGSIFLAEGSGSTLTLSDRVTAVSEVIRTNLANGWPTSSNYTGTVNVTTAPNTYRVLASNEGSLVGTLGTAWNEPKWTNLSIGTYNGNIRNGRTGTKPLNLAIATPALGGTPIDLIRRPVQNENGTPVGASKLGERYFAQASIKILLSDDPADIANLPCTDTSKAPVDLRTLAVPVASLPAWYAAGVPLVASGAQSATTYNPANGYWLPPGAPIITGYLKVEIQTAYDVPCGSWKDVTQEILNLGVAGRNLNPLTTPTAPLLPPLGTLKAPPSTCADPNPDALIRLERIRDNPSNASTAGACGINGAMKPTLPMDYWPNVLFDTREGNPRDTTLPLSTPTLRGVMHYVELDVNNLARWFTGLIGTSGPQAKDTINATYNFVVYFSDRRGNYTAVPLLGGWPPASPTGHETGEYGFQDFVNPGNQFGCPNGTLDPGEDLDGTGGSPQTYGQVPVLPANLLAGVTTSALTANPNCAVLSPSPIWPGTFVTQAQDARENPPLFFRRALKLTNGNNINLGTCPGGVPCGLTIASENPVYIQGDFNYGGSFTGPHVPAAVIADAFTFLSNNWNDINSFRSPYSTSARVGTTTSYRVAVAAGKGISFPQPTGYASPQDFGTDGGVHNFLRYLESWSGATLNYRGSIVSLYYNRQATGLYKCCTTVYSPPTRGYNFDTDFLQPNLLPPRTPMFRDVNTTGFSQLIKPNQ
jgi:hypothetical protein